jgi:hypothetical protein
LHRYSFTAANPASGNFRIGGIIDGQAVPEPGAISPAFGLFTPLALLAVA